MGPLNKPLPFSARVFDGLNHQVQVFRNKDGKPIRNPENDKRPAGMSGRQWKRTQRAARATSKQAAAAHSKRVSGFFGMGQK